MRSFRLLSAAVLLLVLPFTPAVAGDEEPAETAKQIKKLRGLAREVLDKIEADPNIHALRSLGRLRDELDHRRDRALMALYYPVDTDLVPRVGKTRQILAKIVARRVAAVAEIWDEKRAVVLPQESGIGQQLRFLGRVIADLEKLGDAAPRLREAAGVLPIYWYRTDVGIRDFYRTKQETKDQQYDRWVMEIYNAAREADIDAEARRQVHLTNAYRRMIAYIVHVKAGTAITAEMDETAILNALDTGTITKRTPIRAMRIDKRLVASAKSHARSMSQGRYFSHMVPNSVTTHTGRSPGDRMRAAGYKGKAMSENLAAGAKQAVNAHHIWRHSAAQHRNLLAPWADIGVAAHENRWVQNFATGDGGPQTVQPDLTPRRGS